MVLSIAESDGCASVARRRIKFEASGGLRFIAREVLSVKREGILSSIDLTMYTVSSTR